MNRFGPSVSDTSDEASPISEGIGPEKKLSSKFNSRSESRKSSDGRAPLKALFARFRDFKLEAFSMVGGSRPLKLLDERFNISIVVPSANAGRPPKNAFRLKSTAFKLLLAKTDAGTDPAISF